MCFKPAKSRSLVLRKGKVEDNFWFNTEGTAITIHHRETNQEPKQVFDSLLWDVVPSESTCCESEICGQVWPTWDVDSLGVSAWHSSLSPVSPPHLCSSNLKS